ncbi:unnamed protein product [Linum trigynum]|uniref:Uncharacterized protein n=1 Tax=Linum trigynum TaxID=586398 RepID=A0AAV2EFH9_9ROSI
MPNLKDPEPLASMTTAIADVSQRETLENLGFCLSRRHGRRQGRRYRENRWKKNETAKAVLPAAKKKLPGESYNRTETIQYSKRIQRRRRSRAPGPRDRRQRQGQAGRHRGESFLPEIPI